MPHSKHGAPLLPGDRVLIEGRIKAIHPGVERCNVVIEIVEKLGEDESPTTITLHSKQLAHGAITTDGE